MAFLGPEVVLPLMEPAQDCALSPATTKHFMTFLVTQSQSETLGKQQGNKDLQHIVELLLVFRASLNFSKFQVLNGFNRLHWCWRGILLPTGWATEVDHREWGGMDDPTSLEGRHPWVCCSLAMS